MKLESLIERIDHARHQALSLQTQIAQTSKVDPEALRAGLLGKVGDLLAELQVVGEELRQPQAERRVKVRETAEVQPQRDADLSEFAPAGDLPERELTEESTRKLNQELNRRVAELQSLLDVLPVGICVAHDRECLDMTLNPAGARLLNIPLDQNPSKSSPTATALPFKIMRGNEEVPVPELPMQQAATSGYSLHDVELDVVYDTGRRLNLLEYATPLYDEAAQIRGCLGVFVDITPRKAVEQRLALQYAVARALAESMEVNEAAVKVLQAVCEAGDWEFGALWQVDPAKNVFSHHSLWQSPVIKSTEFADSTRDARHWLPESLPGRVVASKGPVWVADVLADLAFPRAQAAANSGLNSAFAFPIRNEGEITGVVECFSRSLQSPSSEVVELLDAISNQLGVFLERKRAEDRLGMRARQQAVVAELGQRALAGLSLQELMDEAVASVALTLSMDFCKILELTPAGDRLLLRAGVGWKAGYVGHAAVGADLDSQAGYTLSIDEPVIVTDLATETRFQGPALLVEHGVVSGVSVKIPGRDRPFGVLGTHSTRRHTFTADDVHFLQAVAHVLASAIDRNRAEEALRLSRNEIAAILSGVADGITAQLPGGQLVYANDAAARLVGYAGAVEFMTAPLAHLADRFELFDETGAPLPFDRLPGRLILNGQDSPPLNLRFKVRHTGEEHWSMVKAQPVLNEARQVVMAVNIFQDITDLKRSELAQRLLAQVGEQLAGALDSEDHLPSIAQLAVPHFADWCAIDLMDEHQRLRRVAVAHVDPAKIEWAHEIHRRFPPDPEAEGGAYAVIRTGKSNFYPTIPAALLENITNPELLDLVHKIGFSSSMTVPLIARGRGLGAMSFVWAESGHHYTRDDLALAEDLARRAALALDNAHLYAQAQRLNTELEQRVVRRTAQLQTTNVRLKKEIDERRLAEEQIRQLNVELEQRVSERTDQLGKSNRELQQEITDRKQAERALRLSLQKTRELYEVSQNISLVRTPAEALQVLLDTSYLKHVTRGSAAIFNTAWSAGHRPEACTILTAWNRETEVPLHVGEQMTLEDYGVIEQYQGYDPLVIDDVRHDPRVSESMRQRILSLGTASSILFPLIAGGVWYGMLSLHFKFIKMMDDEDIRHLRGLVDEAAMAIYNLRLLEAEARARQEAERANNLKLKFLAMISHELRTPLASIKGFATTLLANDVTWEPDSQHDFIATINVEADKLNDLIEQLLDLSRLEAGTLRIAIQVEAWDNILATAQAQLVALTTEHELIVKAPADLPALKVDALRVAQVITNLVNNATRYSPPHSTITLTAGRLDDRYIKVSVSDQGRGIPPAARSNVFEAFQQLHAEKNESKGAGLGLAICRGLIDSHGGRIWIEDQAGPGTTISFTLPTL